MKNLVIKSTTDTFERTVNSWFEDEGVFVMGTDAITNGYNGIRGMLHAFIKLKRTIKGTSYDKIIVFENISLYLLICLFSSKCYLWMWNTIANSYKIKIKLFFANLTKRVYSFDPGDCERFRLKFNTQFFKFGLNSELEEKTKIFFIGVDKNRYNLINGISQYCLKNKIDVDLRVIPETNKQYENRDIICERFVDYPEVLTAIQSTCAVLDICKTSQVGMTFRTLEAVFLDKKIITNNVNYKSFDFYDCDKIYVIEDESFSGLKAFLESESITYKESVKVYYSIQEWIKRFK